MIISRRLAIAGLLSVGGCAASSAQTDAENMSNNAASTGNFTATTVNTVRPERLVVRLPRWVSANMGDITPEPYLELFEMGALVRHYKTAQQLRVTYHRGALGGSSPETDLYDRRMHTLKLFRIDATEVSFTAHTTLYIHVTDAALLKLTAPGAEKSLGRALGQGVSYEDIPTFGAVLKRRTSDETFN